MNVYGSPIAIKVSVTEANKPFSSLIKYCKESQDNNLKHKQNSILSYYYHNFFKLIIFFIVCLETKIIKGSYTFKLFQRLGTRAIYEELQHSFTHLFQPTNTHKLSNDEVHANSKFMILQKHLIEPVLNWNASNRQRDKNMQ